MVIALLAAFLKDVVTTARTEAFFDLSQAKREEEIGKRLGAAYPRAMTEYLATVSPEAFAADVQALLPVITASHGVPGHLLESTKEASTQDYRLDLPETPVAKSASKDKLDPAAIPLSPEFLSDVRALLQDLARDTQAERRPNGCVRAFAAALSAEVADAFDQGAAWSSSTQAAAALDHLFTTGRAVEAGREIQRFLQEQVGIASPTVQSPLPLTASDQAQMRSTLRERYPGSFPLFEVESSLGGGLRLFYKGELLDESWMTHIARVFAHLRTQR